MNSMNVQMKFHGQQSQPGEARFPLKRKFNCRVHLTSRWVVFDFSLTVKAAPHECVIRTGQPETQVKAENEAWFY